MKIKKETKEEKIDRVVNRITIKNFQGVRVLNEHELAAFLVECMGEEKMKPQTKDTGKVR